MSVAIAVWSTVLKAGKKELFSPGADLRITNATLGEKLADENGRTTVKLAYSNIAADEEEEEEDGEEVTVLCSLTAGKIEQCVLDIVLREGEKYTLETVGKNTIYLSGNYIDQGGPDQDPFDSDSEDEEDFDLRDVSSDVEIDPNELDVPSDNDERFEEVEEATVTVAATSKKRPHDGDELMDVDGQADGQLSKAQRKKLAKKQKAEGGKAVPTGETEGATPAPAKPAKAAGEATKDAKSKKEKKEKKAAAETEGELKELPGGLKIKDKKKGSGPQAKKGQRVSMRYIGKLENGKVFDSNVKGKPFWFKIGGNEVIPGWDQGVAGMQVGGERTLVVPPSLGYGRQKLPGIPPNSTLIFEVKLVQMR